MREEGNDGDQLFKKLLDISGNKFVFSDFYGDKGWNMDGLRQAVKSIQPDGVVDAVGDPQQRAKKGETRKPSTRNRAGDRKDARRSESKGREDRRRGGQKRKSTAEQQGSSVDAKKQKREDEATIPGKVVQFLRSKHYGFLSVTGYTKDVFFHQHDVIGQNDLSDGCWVTIGRIVAHEGQKSQAFGIEVVKRYGYGPPTAHNKGDESSRNSVPVSSHHGSGSTLSRIHRSRSVSPHKSRPSSKYRSRTPHAVQTAAGSAPREGPGSAQQEGAKDREKRVASQSKQTASHGSAGYGTEATKSCAPRTFTTHGHSAAKKLPRMQLRRGARTTPRWTTTLRRNISTLRRSRSRRAAKRDPPDAGDKSRRSRRESLGGKSSKRSLSRDREEAQGSQRKPGSVDPNTTERIGKTHSRSRALGSTAATSHSPGRSDDKDHLAFSNAGATSRSPARSDDKGRLVFSNAGATPRSPSLGEQRASPVASRAASDSGKEHGRRTSDARSPISRSEKRGRRKNSGGSIVDGTDTLSAVSPSASPSMQADHGDSVSPVAGSTASREDLPVADVRAQEKSRISAGEDRGSNAQGDLEVSAKSELVAKASGPRPAKVFTFQRQATVVKWWPHKAYGFMDGESLQQEIGEPLFFRLPKGQHDIKIGDTISFDRLRFSEGGDPSAVNPMVHKPSSSSSRDRPPLTLVSRATHSKPENEEPVRPTRVANKAVYSSGLRGDLPLEIPSPAVSKYGRDKPGSNRLGDVDTQRSTKAQRAHCDERQAIPKRDRSGEQEESRGRSKGERDLPRRNRTKPQSSHRRGKSAASRHIVPRTIFFNNVPFDFTTRQCEDLFSQVGAIAELRLFMRNNGASKGMGICCFEKKGVAERAIANLQGKLVGQKNARKLFIELHNK
eukprot:GEMP01016327.1.p1 GENE.GEMP01016327.1~~GEMP01016327.1.p1  ORF type:complete len:896 (-),score=211.51 GEMP01016327.1:106-2793(-)